MCLRSPPVLKSMRAMACPLSRQPAPSARPCRMRMCRAGSRIFHSPSVATSRCARRCMRCFSIMPLRRAWIWALSMPVSSPFMKALILNCARPARMWCSIRVPMPQNAYWKLRKNSAAPDKGNKQRLISHGGNGRLRSVCLMRWSMA